MTTITLGRKVVYSAVGGFVFTLIMALLPNTAVIGVLAYGYPFPWLIQSFSPFGRMALIWSSLILDYLIWTVVTFLIIKLYQMLKINRKE